MKVIPDSEIKWCLNPVLFGEPGYALKGVLFLVPMLCRGLFTVPVLCGYKCLGGAFKILISKYSPDFLFL
jgi:hypothetical protein